MTPTCRLVSQRQKACTSDAKTQSTTQQLRRLKGYANSNAHTQCVTLCSVLSMACLSTRANTDTKMNTGWNASCKARVQSVLENSRSVGSGMDQKTTRGSQERMFTPNLSGTSSSRTASTSDHNWRYRYQVCDLPCVSPRGVKIHISKQHGKDMTADLQQSFKGSVADKLVRHQKRKSQQEVRPKIYCNDSALDNVYVFTYS